MSIPAKELGNNRGDPVIIRSRLQSRPLGWAKSDEFSRRKSEVLSVLGRVESSWSEAAPSPSRTGAAC